MPEPDHTISLAVWDLTSPVVVGRRATLKVGLACSSGCDLGGTCVDIYDDAGTRVGNRTLGPSPWPATAALYWAELDVAGADSEGEHSWTIRVTTPQHGHVTSIVRFAASEPPEHRVTLEVTEKNSGLPLGGVELRVGRFRAATDDAGIAHVEVPGGTYEVGTWKNGYEVLSQTAAIASDTTVHLELTAEPEVERPYWM